jgi:hypothetical protein
MGGEGKTYFALQDAETALEDVHDGVVDAFPVVDDFVVVDARNQEDRTIVFASLFYALLLGFFGVPAPLLGVGFFRLGDEA